MTVAGWYGEDDAGKIRYSIRNGGDDAQNTSATNRTFSINLAEPLRRESLVVAAIGWGLSGSVNANSATIAGVAATKLGESDGSNVGLAVFAAVVPKGTSVIPVAVVMSGATARSGCQISVVEGFTTSALNASSFPAGAGTASRSASLTIPAGGGAIAFCTDGDLVGAWSAGVTEIFRKTSVSNYGFSTAIALANVATPVTFTNSACRVISAVAFK